MYVGTPSRKARKTPASTPSPRCAPYPRPSQSPPILHMGGLPVALRLPTCLAHRLPAGRFPAWRGGPVFPLTSPGPSRLACSSCIPPCSHGTDRLGQLFQLARQRHQCLGPLPAIFPNAATQGPKRTHRRFPLGPRWAGPDPLLWQSAVCSGTQKSDCRHLETVACCAFWLAGRSHLPPCRRTGDPSVCGRKGSIRRRCLWRSRPHGPLPVSITQLSHHHFPCPSRSCSPPG